MIKAQEAKNITRSVELSEEILNKISIAIITAASKGEYSVDIFLYYIHYVLIIILHILRNWDMKQKPNNLVNMVYFYLGGKI